MNAAKDKSGQPRNKWRRRFLITAGVAGGALAIGAWRFYRSRDKLSPPDALKPGKDQAVLTGWIKIGTDGSDRGAGAATGNGTGHHHRPADAGRGGARRRPGDGALRTGAGGSALRQCHHDRRRRTDAAGRRQLARGHHATDAIQAWRGAGRAGDRRLHQRARRLGADAPCRRRGAGDAGAGCGKAIRRAGGRMHRRERRGPACGERQARRLRRSGAGCGEAADPAGCAAKGSGALHACLGNPSRVWTCPRKWTEARSSASTCACRACSTPRSRNVRCSAVR